jgi:NAD(P)-dependent dehydrogenase (short-subunit alcohol dehydrogenase family)
VTKSPIKTWLVTGVSSGFGRALAEAVLARGDRIAGTVRNAAAKAAFEALAPDRAFGFLLDVTDEAAVHRTVISVERELGPIDVLVNNAGYGLEGSVEATSLAEMRAMFDVNLFGAVAVMQAALPSMRARRSGHIVNITSMGGITTWPGIGAYCASKFALEGLSETLAQELAPLGIRLTIVEPGGFRTNFASRSLGHAARTIDDYEATAGNSRRILAEHGGHEPGDPHKAALAILKAVDAEKPPLHLLLGPDALLHVGEKLGALIEEIGRWAVVSATTGFDAVPESGE